MTASHYEGSQNGMADIEVKSSGCKSSPEMDKVNDEKGQEWQGGDHKYRAGGKENRSSCLDTTEPCAAAGQDQDSEKSSNCNFLAEINCSDGSGDECWSDGSNLTAKESSTSVATDSEDQDLVKSGSCNLLAEFDMVKDEISQAFNGGDMENRSSGFNLIDNDSSSAGQDQDHEKSSFCNLLTELKSSDCDDDESRSIFFNLTGTKFIAIAGPEVNSHDGGGNENPPCFNLTDLESSANAAGQEEELEKLSDAKTNFEIDAGNGLRSIGAKTEINVEDTSANPRAEANAVQEAVVNTGGIIWNLLVLFLLLLLIFSALLILPVQ